MDFSSVNEVGRNIMCKSQRGVFCEQKNKIIKRSLDFSSVNEVERNIMCKSLRGVLCEQKNKMKDNILLTVKFYNSQEPCTLMG